MGNWQSGMKRFKAALAEHPDVVSVEGGHASAACFGHWREDEGGRAWLHSLGGAKVPSSFDPARHLLFAGDCVAQMAYYPGFAGRYHKFWEQTYWPCKAECMRDARCKDTYYEDTQWRTCKPRALAAHDAAVAAPGGAGSAPLTPPWLMSHFYGGRARLVVMLRCPVKRVRTAFSLHPHYPKRYGKGAQGLDAFAVEQVQAWQKCVHNFSVWRCAVHFEQLGPEQAEVFFHCDQLIRSMYSIFMRDWVAAFPKGVLAVRTEDFYERTRRRAVLARAWAHMGLRPLEDAHPTVQRLLAMEPGSAGEWEERRVAPCSEATVRLLAGLFAPFNAELRELLLKDGTSCTGSECDMFLWRE